jgi:hypothetical protein
MRPLFLIEFALLFGIAMRVDKTLVGASILVLFAVVFCICSGDRWPRMRYLAYIPAIAIIAVLISCDSRVYLEKGVLVVALAVAAHFTGEAITWRFDRYLRTIERSYDAFWMVLPPTTPPLAAPPLRPRE